MPQPQKTAFLSLDNPLKIPHTTSKLSSLAENDEIPGAFPDSEEDTPTAVSKHIAKAVSGGLSTPRDVTSIRPSGEEMHPAKFHMSTAKPLDEARWLGFSSMAPQIEPPKGTNKIALAQGTPSKTPKAGSTSRSDFQDFEFSFKRQSLELSAEARQMMAEKREEAARIREELKANKSTCPSIPETLSRKMATPKGKVGRFSDIHMAEFKKMDSIANHASAYRADPNRLETATATLKKAVNKPLLAQPGQNGVQTLKRTQSKTELGQYMSSLPRSTSSRSLKHNNDAEHERASPAKRVKRTTDDDVASTRPKSSGMPTGAMQASLARTASVNSTKSTMIPSLARTPSKASLKSAPTPQPKASTPLLARSPTKSSPVKQMVEEPQEPVSPLLSRSPSKFCLIEKPATQTQDADDDAAMGQYLSRSPLKASVSVNTEQDNKPSAIPLLSRSPAKASPAENPFDTAATPLKAAAGTNLMSRFNLLRKTPMKSILRSPQRLYSDDPAKVASGTHLATPPKNSNKALPAVPPATAPVQKHVDFSASTKLSNSMYQAQRESESTSLSPVSEGPTPPPKTSAFAKAATDAATEAAPTYPILPSGDMDMGPTPKKAHRRMTLGANVLNDFTFRAGEGITFAPSADAANRGRADSEKPSIRHVSAEPDIVPIAGMKRKLSETPTFASATSLPIGSDKENKPEEGPEDARPAKKARPTIPEPPKSVKPAEKIAKKIPTIGVKPKGTTSQQGKKPRPSMMSRTRLEMLAMPKHRRGEQ